ncbi:MAG: hypothetical protein IJN90_02765 [Bacilli bacterium]|nr:hypothetical protein [Bacilli bacterium]
METLGQYFSYNNDPEKVQEVFISLDNQLKLIHSKGYSVDINSSTIVYENGLGFSNFNKGLTESQRKANIEDLAKLAVGTYFSLPTGSFSDYTHLPNEYMRENFDIMEASILKSGESDNYYREVLVEGKVGYYSDYIETMRKNNPQSKNNNRVLTYSTPEGKAMSKRDDAAFIDLAFYPILITITIILAYIVYILFI